LNKLMEDRNIRVGIVGTGFSARDHLAALKSIQGIEVVGIAGERKDEVSSLAKQFSIDWCADSAQELIASQRIEAVIIAVPPFVQPDLAVLAFENKKHVLCEKPLAPTLGESRRMVEARIKSGCVGMINFCFRLLPLFQEFKTRIASGDCGKLHSIDAQWILSNRLNPSLTFHWKGQRELGGGVLQNFGSHVLDFLFYDTNYIKLLEARQNILTPVRYDDKGNKCRITGDEETIAVFNTGDGVRVNIHLSLVSEPAIGYRIIARGDKGALELRNSAPNAHAGPFLLWFYEKGEFKGRCMSSDNENEKYSRERLFSEIHKLFVEAVNNNDNSMEPSLESGLKVSELIAAIQEMAGNKR